MNIYMGRWELLPPEWEGINGLYGKTEEEIALEITRQQQVCEDALGDDDDYIGRYNPLQFEETFNQDLEKQLTSDTYFIKIYE